MRNPSSFDGALLNRLSRSEDLHEFLSSVFLGSGPEEPRLFTYAAFARRAKLHTRSLPREVTLGKRALSPLALHRFVMGFRFSGAAERYFCALAARKYPRLASDRSSEELQAELQKLRPRLLNPRASTSAKTDIYRIEDWPLVYSALGRVDQGATLEEICRRARLSRDVCVRILAGMKNFQVLKVESERYIPINSHLVFSELSTRGAFREYYSRMLRKAGRAAEGGLLDPTQLHFAANFSVAKSRREELREELKQIAMKYAEASEEPLGDEIASLVVSFF